MAPLLTEPPSLAALRDIHLPPNPSAWPPAWGWWLLTIALIAGLVFVARRAYRRHRSQAPLRVAITRIRTLRREHQGNHLDNIAVAGEVSMLLREVALLRYSRIEVAGLTGERWLTFLNTHGGDGAFTTDLGRALLYTSYGSHERIDIPLLLGAAEGWIQSHL